MQTWQAWLNSLATRGGAIMILLMLSLLGVGVTLLAIWRGWDGNMFIGGLLTTLGNFSGALLLALKGSSDPVAPPITSQQTTTTTTAEAPNPEPPKSATITPT